MSEYIKSIETGILELAHEQYESIVSRLLSDEFRDGEIDCVENFLRKEGAEMLRRLLQGFLDGQSRDEIKLESVTGADGIKRTCKREHCSRQVMTIFGEVTVNRIGYSKAGTRALFPLDASLNLPASKYSQGLQVIVAEAAAKESFAQTVSDIQKHTAGWVPKRQVEQITQAVSGDFDAFYEQKRREEPESIGTLLIMTTDAKGVVVRHEDLREVTRKAAENEQHKKQTRLSRGEKKNRKRMAQVASVYSVEAHPRTAESVMDKSGARQQTPRPKPKNKRVWASLEKGTQEVVAQMFEEARGRDPKQQRQWVVLVDGNESQINHIEIMAKTMRLGVAIMMDFIHVLEYVWKAAYALWGENGDRVEGWVHDCAIRLLQSETSSVAAVMRAHATRQELTPAQREPVDKCADYLLKNKVYLDYQTALEKGWPIATGIIEGACRHLIKDRMDITGARWSLPGAESVIKLRALKSSDDFDAYMDFYKEKERARNYGGQWVDAAMPKAA